MISMPYSRHSSKPSARCLPFRARHQVLYSWRSCYGSALTVLLPGDCSSPHDVSLPPIMFAVLSASPATQTQLSPRFESGQARDAGLCRECSREMFISYAWPGYTLSSTRLKWMFATTCGSCTPQEIDTRPRPDPLNSTEQVQASVSTSSASSHLRVLPCLIVFSH